MFSTILLSRALATAALIATTALAACGDDDKQLFRLQEQRLDGDQGREGGGPGPGRRRRARARSTVAADATYPPNEFLDEDGQDDRRHDPDLANALGKVLGVKIEIVNAPFDGIMPGLAAGKYDLGLSRFTDTKEREQTVDFVTYFSAGTSFFVRADRAGPTINGLADLCGHKVAVEKGTIQADDAEAQAQEVQGGRQAGR